MENFVELLDDVLRGVEAVITGLIVVVHVGRLISVVHVGRLIYVVHVGRHVVAVHVHV